MKSTGEKEGGELGRRRGKRFGNSGDEISAAEKPTQAEPLLHGGPDVAGRCDTAVKGRPLKLRGVLLRSCSWALSIGLFWSDSGCRRRPPRRAICSAEGP